MFRRGVRGALLSLLLPAAAQAQPLPQPIPRVVIDARAFFSGLGQDPVTAAGLGVPASDLPTRGLGGVAGLHVVAVRRGSLAFSIGGEGLLARGRRTSTVQSAAPLLPIPPVTQRLEGLSAQLSLGFGQSEGWSYLTGGMGPMRFATWQGDARPALAPPAKATINLGGGARWFARRHLAVTFDVRFYLTRPETATEDYPGRQRSRLLILSAGIALK